MAAFARKVALFDIALPLARLTRRCLSVSAITLCIMSTFMTSTAAEEAEQSAQALRVLQQEVDLLRGVGGLGVPALDHEVESLSAAQAPVAGHESASELHVPSSPQLEREPELPSVVDELDSAQLRLVEELERQRLQRDHEGRAGLQAELRRQEGEAQVERGALLAYLEELRGRDDEAGSEIRGDGFGLRVEQLAAEEHSRRGVAEAQQGFAQLAAITDDPKLREQPLRQGGRRRLGSAAPSMPPEACVPWALRSASAWRRGGGGAE